MTWRKWTTASARLTIALATGLIPLVATPQAPGTTSGNAFAQAAPLSAREEIAVRATLLPQRVYVGQQATYVVGVFLREDVRARLRRNPEFVPPELRAMLFHDLAPRNANASRTVDGTRFDAHLFQRALFPLSSGRHEIPAARLNYALPLSNSIFSREESHTLRTESTVLVALDPPLSGRPTDFSGAVGRLSLDVRGDRRRSRVGEPMTVTLIVSGVGNITLLPRPQLSVPWGEAVPAAERVVLDTTAALVRGRKEFDFVVTPRQAGALQLPAQSYAYFDPYEERYATAVSKPYDVNAGGGSLAGGMTTAADTVPLLPIRRVYQGELALPLPTRGWFWLVLALIPLPALGLSLARRPRRSDGPSAAQRVATLVRTRTFDVRALRRDYAAALVERTGVSPSTLTSPAALTRYLRRHGVSTPVARDAGAILGELDAAVFGESESTGDAAEIALRAHRVLDGIHREALPRTAAAITVSRGILGATLIAVAATTAWAAADAGAARFRDAVAAYDARSLDEAQRLFLEVAAEHPRATDAWANAGTVAWQLRDTAGAVVNWQRAARLDPRAADVRANLEATPGFRSGILGDVPPVSVNSLASLGALLWISAWGVVLVGPVASRRRWATGLGSAAVIAGLLTIVLSDQLTGRHVRVVTRAGQMRSAPALTAEGAGQVVVGETGRETAAQGAWRRVRFADGRHGWIAGDHVASVSPGR